MLTNGGLLLQYLDDALFRSYTRLLEPADSSRKLCYIFLGKLVSVFLLMSLPCTMSVSTAECKVESADADCHSCHCSLACINGPRIGSKLQSQAVR